MRGLSKKLFFLCFSVILVSSAATFITDLLRESGSVSLLDKEYHSHRIGFVSSGGLIQVRYTSDGNSIDFFIVNRGNWSRLLDGLPYDRHSFRSGTYERFNITVPYSDTWYAVFYNPLASILFDYIEYEIHPPLSPYDYVVLSVFFGSVAVLVAGLIAYVKAEFSRAETRVTERIAERRTELPYEEEAIPEYVESKTPVISCPRCGYKNPSDAQFCIRCGRDLEGSL